MRCLEHFCQQTLAAHRWEVVLVNDGSTDDTHEVVHKKQWPFQLRYIRQENTGLAGARNTAIQAAQGNILLLINDDTMAAPDFIEKHLAAQNAHPRSMVLGAFDYEPWALESAFMQVVNHSTVVFGYPDLTPGGKYDYMFSYTCNLSVPAEAYQQAGLFDTSFKSYGAEDTEMGYRLEKAGYRVVYCPEAHADHAHALTVDEFIKRQINVGSNFARFFRIHPEVIRQPRWGRACESSRFQVECNVEAQAEAISKTVQEIRNIEAAWKKADEKKRPDLVAKMEPLVRQISGYYWMAGLAKGMQREELNSFSQLPDRRLPMVPGAFGLELASGLALSVILPTYNRLSVLQECLARLVTQTLAPDRFEVLICDDGSTDGTQAFMETYSAPFRVQYLRDKNQGPGMARNRGITHAQGKIAVIINDDTMLSPTALQQHLECHLQWNDAPIAVMGAYWPSKNCVPTPLQCVVDELFFPRDELEPNRLHDFRAMWTCNLSLAVKALRDSGGFDDRFYMAAAEDTDLGIRLAEQYGYRILYRPDIIAFHQHQHSFDSFKRSCLLRGRMTYHLVAKHPWLIPQWFGITEFDGWGISQLKERVAQLSVGIPEIEIKLRALEQLFKEAGPDPDPAMARRLALQIRPELAKLHLYYNRQGTVLEIEKQQLALDSQFTDNLYYKRFPLRNSWSNRFAFSIVLPADKETGLDRALSSLRHQSYCSWELVLVDRTEKGSLRTRAKDLLRQSVRCHYIHCPDVTEAEAIRTGTEIAQGNLFLVLKPGTVLHEHFLHSIFHASQGSEAGLFCPNETRKKAAARPGDVVDPLTSPGDKVPSPFSVVRAVLWKRFYSRDICNENWWNRLCERIIRAGFPIKQVPVAFLKKPENMPSVPAPPAPMRSAVESLAMLLIATNWRETVLARMEEPSPELLSCLREKAAAARVGGDADLAARLDEMISDLEAFFPEHSPKERQGLELSVVIPTFNRKDKLLRCLDMLSRQSLPFSWFEVIIVDDGSTDDTEKALRKQKYPFQLRIFKQSNLGPAAARNRGIAEASGNIIVFLGDDIYAPADFLKGHLRHHRIFPEAGEALLGHIDWATGLTVTPFMEFITGPSGAQFSFDSIRDPENVGSIHFYTSNLSLKKKYLLLEQPVFDAKFIHAACEDTDLGYRLAKRGMRLRYRAKIMVHHDHPTDITRFSQRQFRAGQMSLLFAAKHPESTMAIEISDYLQSKQEVFAEVFNDDAHQKLLAEAVRLERAITVASGIKPEKCIPLEKVYSQILQRFYTRGVLSGADRRTPPQAMPASRVNAPATMTFVHPAAAAPRVSIVIPTFNKLELTRQCLLSLQKYTVSHPCELIVVDNGSTDGTVGFLKSEETAGHLRAVLNPKNLGFAKACNQGAEVARGRYVVFMNNDTEVQNGWLAPMISLAETDATIAGVGSKLLFPDGTLQHAGVALGEVVGRDPLLAVHTFYKAPADLPEANQRRVYQALTAACLLVRKSAFDAVGGFDEGFWNGYEDVDLCLRFQERGWLMVYEPASVVIHHESQSGPARFQKVQENIRRLHQKWLGKAKLDVIVAADGAVTPAATTRIRPYVPGTSGAAPTSIVVLSHNQLAHTKACLESIARHTSEPYELILVDNASTDGTLPYLQEYAAQHERVLVVANRTNRGFAAGNNQGMALATGRQVLLLNNDTVVTPGWLGNMLRVLREHPQTGVVGPRSNRVLGRQQVDGGGYTSLDELPAFAAAWAEKHAGESRLANRVVGFCLLARREVIETVGGLDEQFGSGNFEDDDFCIRAHLAGFETRIADDSFVHHVGSATFTGAGIDYSKAMQTNWSLFKSKWAIPPETPPVPGYLTPDVAPPGVALKVPLPELRLTHQTSANGRCWMDKLLTAAAAKARPIALPPCALLGHLGEARQFFNNKKFPAAWGAVRAALKHRPFHPEAYLLLAEIALAAQDSVAARACAQFARHIAPDFKPAKKFLKASLHGNLKPEWIVLPDEIGKQKAESRNHLTVCLIVKNEERFLGQCLESVKGLAHQIVVVDTGSTDRTVEIAKQHKAEVHSFVWCDDFSAARNAALEHVTGDWVLMLDADEELPPEQHETLRKLLRSAPVISWRLPLQDVGREAEGCIYVPRLFRNAPELFYVGRVHEQVFPSLEVRRQEWGLETRLGDAALRHYGYTKELTLERDKVGRNLRLIEQAILETPGAASLLMNYGLELTRSGRQEEGLRQYRAAFEAMADQPPAMLVPESREMLLTQFGTQLMAAKRHAEIIQVLTSPSAKLGAGLTASLHFTLGLAYMELKQFAEAAEQFRQCLAKRDRPALAPVNVEIRKAGPRHCLALCLAQTKDTAAAERELELARKDDPESVPVVTDYARFLHDQGQSVEGLQLLHGFTAEHPQAAAAWLGGGVIALSRAEFLEVAVDWTAEALRHFPEDAGIQSQRAEALLLSGQPEAALPLWRQLAIGGKPLPLGALILCETAVGKNECASPPELAAAVTQEFVHWYRRLLEFGAEPTVLRVNAGVAGLERVLPRAAELLRAVIADVGQKDL